ncbi:MAG: modA [Candidatus Angelobacter sp.]|nr:modA [Candidatus Angelobacter sp.]
MFGLSQRFFQLVFALLLFATQAFAQNNELTIAAASDLSAAFKVLTADFEKQTGTHIRTSFGSSGNFYAQVQNGAPFDLFFSADIDYPRKLEAAGLAQPGSLYKYARGRIVLWVPSSSPVDVAKLGMNALLQPSVRKIAIANPEHAPYGRAAMAAMEHYGLAAKVRDKLVFGENISQATLFIETGNAEIGFSALSLALSPALIDRGKFWEVPLDAYPPLEQAVIILASAKNKSAASAFISYLKSPAGVAIMRRFGFIVPGEEVQRL